MKGWPKDIDAVMARVLMEAEARVLTDRKPGDGKAPRQFCPPSDILIYWGRQLPIDWGEIECFGCRQFGYRGDAIHVNDWNKRQLQRAHLIAHCFGGPEQAWNIMYLCRWCHFELDGVISGKPHEYEKSVKWVKDRRQHVVAELAKAWTPLYRYPELADPDSVYDVTACICKLMGGRNIRERALARMPMPPWSKRWDPMLFERMKAVEVSNIFDKAWRLDRKEAEV